jgi:hypothetical protein
MPGSLTAALLLDMLRRQPETFSSGFSTRATVGIMLKDKLVDQMVVGGVRSPSLSIYQNYFLSRMLLPDCMRAYLQPAYMCNQLTQGDEIVEIDGTVCRTKEEIPPLLKGSDLPGSTVVVTVKRVRTDKLPSLQICMRANCFARALTHKYFSTCFLCSRLTGLLFPGGRLEPEQQKACRWCAWRRKP